MYTNVEIRKNDDEYLLFIDGKFIKKSKNIIELAEKIEEFE